MTPRTRELVANLQQQRTVTAFLRDGKLLVTMNWKLVVVAQMLQFWDDLGWLLGQVLDIFGREALGDLGDKLATTLAVVFMTFPVVWLFLIGPTGAVGEQV